MAEGSCNINERLFEPLMNNIMEPFDCEISDCNFNMRAFSINGSSEYIDFFFEAINNVISHWEC